MIKLIRRALEKRCAASQPATFVFVKFNYQGCDDARAALIEVIATKLAAEADERETAHC